MEKITYGAPRLVDWVAQIKVGSASVRVHFTGGALTSYGVTPAEYTTSNPFIQKVIENSSYFKEGRIIVQRRATIDSPHKPASKGKSKSQPVEASHPHQKDEEGICATATGTPSESEEDGIADSEPVSASDAEGASPVKFTKVEVTCLPDAQAYLQENFSISSYKVRSYEVAQRIAAEHGIQFTGGKFDTLKSIKESEGDVTEE